MTKDYNLEQNPSFCMLGLLHTYVGPNGNVMPCCVGDITKPPLGNINTVSSWDEIWNGENYKEFRRKMIAGEKNPICSFCYDTEKFSDSSSRKWRNIQYKDEYDSYMSNLCEDGSMKTAKLKYIDFRFSNHCNQACITCGHSLSSSWYDLMLKFNLPPSSPKFIEPQQEKIAYELIDNNLDSVTNIYFAGGEPMLSKYHWYTLEKLMESGRCKEIDLVYSTNCSTLKYKGKDVLEYWKSFKSVLIMASVDDIGERFNYIRNPANWENISQNLKIIHDYFEELNTDSSNITHKLCYAPVLSAFNLHRLKEIIEEFISLGIYQKSSKYHAYFEYFLFSNLIRTPKHLSIMDMPEQHWEMVVQKIEEFKNWYTTTIIQDSPNFTMKHLAIVKAIDKIKEMRKLKSKDMNFFDEIGENYLSYMGEYSKFDEVRGTDFRKTFPELEWLYR